MLQVTKPVRAATICLMLAALFSSGPRLLAGSCPTAVLSVVADTTCTIGDLQFSFEQFRTGSVNNQLSSLTASQVMFTPDNSNPLDPGFTITGSFGVVPASAGAWAEQFTGVFYYYTAPTDFAVLSEEVQLGGVVTNGQAWVMGDNDQCYLSYGCYPEWAFLGQGGADVNPMTYELPEQLCLLNSYGDEVEVTTNSIDGFGTSSADSLSVHYSLADTALPEPSSAVLAATGLLILAVFFRYVGKGV